MSRRLNTPTPVFKAGRPPDSRLIDIRRFGGTPNNPNAAAINDAAITKAMDQFLAGSRLYTTIYFGPGVWYFSESIRWFQISRNRWWYGMTIEGEGQNLTTLRLIDEVVAFSNVAAPKGFIITGGPAGTGSQTDGSGNQAFQNCVLNLTIDTGNNPGVYALDYFSNNRGTAENLTIKCTGGNGFSGVEANRVANGPCLYKNITVLGFRYGFRISNYQFSQTYYNITVQDQTICGFQSNQSIISLENYTSTNNVPAIQNIGDNGVFCLINATLNASASTNSAIVNIEGCQLYLRDINTSGYLSNRTVDLGGGQFITSQSIAEYFSNIYHLNRSPAASLKLPILQTPAPFNSNNLADWANVNRYGNSLDSLQNACNSGKPILYLPKANYSLSNTLAIPTSVKRIVGNQSGVGASGPLWGLAGEERPFFQTVGISSEPLTIEFLSIGSGSVAVGILHTSSRPLILKAFRSFGTIIGVRTAPGAGPVFLEDYGGSNLEVRGSTLYGRSVNTEYDHMFVNDGGTVWLLGFKTEGAWVNIETKNGGQTELLGCEIYPIEDYTLAEVKARFTDTNLPVFVNHESSFSGVFATDGNSANFTPPTFVAETRGGVYKTLAKPDSVPSRGFGVKCALYASYTGLADGLEQTVEDLKAISINLGAPSLSNHLSSLDTYLKALVSNGLMSKVLMVAPAMGESLGSALYFIDNTRGTNRLVKMNSNGFTATDYTKLGGIQGNGSKYLSFGTPLNPQSLTNSSSIGLHFWTSQIETGTGNRYLIAGANSAQSVFTALGRANSRETGTFGGNIFTANDCAGGSNLNLTGMLSVVTNGSPRSQYYNNGTPIGALSVNTPIGSLETGVYLLGGFRRSTTVPINQSFRNMMWSAITKGMSQNEMAAFYELTLAFLQGIGRVPVLARSYTLPQGLGFGADTEASITIAPNFNNTLSATFRTASTIGGVRIADAELIYLDDYISTLKANNLWGKVYAIFPMMGENLSQALVSLRNIGSETVANMTPTNFPNDSTSYTKVGGVQGNSSQTRTINTHLNLSTFISIDNVGLHAWTSQTETAGTYRYLMGSSDLNQTDSIVLGYLNNVESGAIAGNALNANAAGGVAATTGMLSVQGTSTRRAQLYVNGDIAGSLGTVATISQSTFNNDIIGINLLSSTRRGGVGPAGHSNRNMQWGAITQALNAGELSVFYELTANFLTNLGRSAKKLKNGSAPTGLAVLTDTTAVVTTLTYANNVIYTMHKSAADTGTRMAISELTLLDDYITGLKADGLWSSVFAIMPNMGENINHALFFVNNVSGTEVLGTMVNTGIPNDSTGYTKVGGIQGGGTRHIRTTLNPSGFMLPTNGGLHCWTTQTEATNARVLMGYWDSTQTNYVYLGRNSNIDTGIVGGNVNTAAENANGPSTSTAGFLSVVNNASQQNQYYINGAASGALASASSATAASFTTGSTSIIALYILAGFKRGDSVPNSYSSRNTLFNAVTGTLTGAQMATFYNRTRTFLQGLGRVA